MNKSSYQRKPEHEIKYETVRVCIGECRKEFIATHRYNFMCDRCAEKDH